MWLSLELGPRGGDAASVRRGGLVYLVSGFVFLLLGISRFSG